MFDLIFRLAVAYILFYISTIIHEFSHREHAKDLKVRLKSKKTRRFSIVFKEIEFRFPLGARIYTNNKDFKALSPTDKKKIGLAGIKSDLILCIFFSFLVLISSAWFEEWTFPLMIVVLGILGNLYLSIFHKKGDLQILFSFLRR